ncbi:hypothetical protein CspHIS471_0305090 [Cutaneotrichosporon sp. HIS471]|nr:hypothetical protein CspHIS471_0305090 [Cutaneotrichosporon sp. HIS471]
MPNIVVHHLNQSRSDRLFWLLEELNLPYQVIVHYRTPQGRAPTSLTEISPLGKAPAVQVDGKVVTESGFITHYLLKHLNSGLPDLETSPSEDSIFWNHFSEGSLMLHLQGGITAMKVQQGFASFKVLYLLLFFQKGASALAEYIQNITKDNVKPMLVEVDKFLQKNHNFSGSDKLGEGDFMMFYPLNSIARGTRKGEYELGQATKRWLDGVQARPAYQRARERIDQEEAGQKAKL